MQTLDYFVRRNGYVLLLVPALILLIALFVIPIGSIVYTSVYDSGLTSVHYLKLFTTPVYLRIVWNTIQVAVIVTFMCALIGYPTAYIINELSGIWKSLAIVLVILPFWTSILIRTYSWSVLLGQEGIINTLLISLGLIDTAGRMLYNRVAVTMAMTQILAPIVILTCLTSMSKIDGSLVRAARLFGAGPLRAFWHVFLPMSLGGLINGSVLVFILSMGFFITPALLGGPKDILVANLIEQQINQLLNWGFGSALAVVVLVLTMIAVVVLQLTNRSRHRDDES